MNERRSGYLFIAPCIAVIVLVLGIPMLFVMAVSFFKYRPMTALEWGGLANYAAILKNETFWIACKNTFVFTVSSVGFHLLLGMVAAMLLNRSFHGRKLVRLLFLLPWMLSYIVGAITWKWLLNSSYGIFNELMVRLGMIDQYVAWLGEPSTSMLFVVIANIWKQFPFVMLMLLAGLQSIPHEQFEAAWLDGAGGLRCFCSITIPNMKGIIAVTSTLDFIWSFKQFDLIYVMTGGGPGVSTEVLSSLVYKKFFVSFDFGQAAAAAMILLAIVMLISVIYAKLITSDTKTEGY